LVEAVACAMALRNVTMGAADPDGDHLSEPVAGETFEWKCLLLAALGLAVVLCRNHQR